jgi:Spy/CpxP family protein refolding chaperone
MKRIDKNFKLLVAIVVVLGLSLSVMAQQHYRKQMPQRSMMAHSSMQLLDLTEKQKDQIKEIRLAHMKDVQPLKDEVKINRVTVDVLLKADEPDMKKIVSIVEANGKLLTQIQVKNIDQTINVRGLLTDEQKIIYDAHSERMNKRRAMAAHYGHRNIAERSRF